MPRANREEAGFSIVELVIAMFLLALVAVAILPALWQGVRLSSEQSAVATATRELNSLVEQARESPTCAGLASAASSRTAESGGGHTIHTSGTVGTCVAGTAVRVELTATSASGSALATMTAIVYVP